MKLLKYAVRYAHRTLKPAGSDYALTIFYHFLI